MRVYDDFMKWILPEKRQELIDKFEVFDVEALHADMEKQKSPTLIKNGIPCRPPFKKIFLCTRLFGEPCVISIEETAEGIVINGFIRDKTWAHAYSGSIVVDAGWLPDLVTPHKLSRNQDLLSLFGPEKFRYFESSCQILSIWVLQLLNCKNVKTVEHDPLDDMKPAVRAHWLKKGREPLKKHCTIVLTLPGEKKVGGGLSGGERGMRRPIPLHTCRGHFATYTEDSKLFGKYTGTFWVPSCVKGSASAGVTTKDYRLLLDGQKQKGGLPIS